MKFLKPKYIILDELDSGLDVDSLEYIKPQYVHILKDGKIQKTGDAKLALEIEKNGYTGINDESKVDVDE